jgi:ATP-dependent 26S proteasome regulatory subunit
MKNLGEIAEELSHTANIDIGRILADKVEKPLPGQPYVQRIHPGIYDLDQSDFPRSMRRIEVEADETYVFRGEAFDAVRQEIREFWQSGQKYEGLGLMHKRGVLVYGPPGAGKSRLLHSVAEDFVNHGGIVFETKYPYYVPRTLREFRIREKQRPVIVILEDVDEMHSEHSLLQLLDGADSANHVLFIGTTNCIDKIPEKLKRPGRFDRKIQIANPTVEHRQAYLSKKMKGKLEDVQTIAQKTDGLSFGHLRELVVSVYGYGANLDETITRLKRDQKEIERVGNQTYFAGEFAKA